MSTALDEAVLDSPDRLAAVDREGLLRAVATGGAQVRESLALTGEADVPGQLAGLRPRSVLLAADPAADDSAVALAALAAGPEASAPLVRCDGPTLPVWAGPTDVLLAVAHSPVEPAVPALADAAARRGLTVLGVGTAGSGLQEACGRNRAPFVALPTGRHPRAAFWGLLTPMLVGGGELGLLPRTGEDLARSADLLDALAERARPASETFANPAKSLALDIGGALPLVWGTSAPTGAAARRLAGQLAGAGRRSALWGTLPAAAYRQGGVLAGAEARPADLFRDRVEEPTVVRPRLVLVRDADEAVDVRRLVEQLVADSAHRGIPVTEVVAEESAGPVGRLASVVGLLDFAAVYVVLATGSEAEAKEETGIDESEGG